MINLHQMKVLHPGAIEGSETDDYVISSFERVT